ncbi:MAG TPA: Mut7-C RNAse domain-containing protein [Conexivisphaerales archaeon]|nr:Mut7-C RNAse domain-containing protein [Conexivisphaerales archaeon]
MQPKFVADGMLGSLARKLRLYSLDVLYFPDLPDRELLEKSKAEGRVLLTSDRELHLQALRRGVSCVLVSGKDEASMAAQVFAGAGVSPVLDVASARCPLCNGEVLAVGREDVAGVVPPGVLARQKRFYRCSSCQQLYWEGSHWFRLSKFHEEVREAMKI